MSLKYCSIERRFVIEFLVFSPAIPAPGTCALALIAIPVANLLIQSVPKQGPPQPSAVE